MKIFVNKPYITKKVINAVVGTLEEGWISGKGPYVQKFEENFAKKVGVPYAVSTANGTAGLRLAVATLGIGKGDEILIPDLTIISCATAAIHEGATPILVDVKEDTFGIDLEQAEKLVTTKTKAIMVVHLYGQPVRMKPVMKFARKHKLWVISDCSEAFGAKTDGQMVGSFADVSVFSLYANKIITTGEGGIVTFKKKKFADRAEKLKNLFHSDKTRFLHPELGYNFRFSNVLATIGISQLEMSDELLEKKKNIDEWYRNGLSKLPFLELHEAVPNTEPVCWMFTLLLKKNAPFSPDDLAKYLEKNNVETRFFFIPLHKQPALKPYLEGQKQRFPISNDLAARGLYLPSGLGHSKKEITHVVSLIKKYVGSFNQ